VTLSVFAKEGADEKAEVHGPSPRRVYVADIVEGCQPKWLAAERLSAKLNIRTRTLLHLLRAEIAAAR
jgi:hypothetical protein